MIVIFSSENKLELLDSLNYVITPHNFPFLIFPNLIDFEFNKSYFILLREKVMTSKSKLKIGLALGGGGARGFAHIGVLKILNDEGIYPEIVVGTSMGAVTGALYCQNQTAIAAEEKLRSVILNPRPDTEKLNVYPDHSRGDHFFDHITQEIKQRIVINLSISKKALLPAEQLKRSIEDLVDETKIEKLPIAYAAMASDLKTGKGIVLTRGSLRKAIIASSSIPGFFPPVKWNNYLLADGEATDLIPVNACRALGADFVIAIDVQRNIEAKREPKHAIDVFVRAARITNHHLAKSSLISADFVLQPDTSDVNWSDFERLQEVIKAGEWEARAKVSQLKSMLYEAGKIKRSTMPFDMQMHFLEFAEENHD